MLSKVLAAAHPRPSEVSEDVPEALEGVCMCALKVDRSARYSTAAVFAEAVEVAARAHGIDVASAREVAAFVELNAHAAPGDFAAVSGAHSARRLSPAPFDAVPGPIAMGMTAPSPTPADL